ncbi:hypothetical protein FAI40_03075 [Acetobacteraceae bacterium]|nr:hypothetical protein FAI40_03075 [Acetobacteraceae bacterium]
MQHTAKAPNTEALSNTLSQFGNWLLDLMNAVEASRMLLEVSEKEDGGKFDYVYTAKRNLDFILSAIGSQSDSLEEALKTFQGEKA